MVRVRWRALRVLPALGLLAGCQVLGPNSIQVGRLSYNEVIQQTSKQQTFANIVRVKNNEPTAFLEVSQISATVLAQGIAMGGVTNIGLTKPGSANLSLQYQESPTIQYQPLTGAALVAQLTTPITVDSLGNLFNSDWPLASLLTLSVDRITPGFDDIWSAINALIALDNVGAVTFSPSVVAAGSTAQVSALADRKSAGPAGGAGKKPPSTAGTDTPDSGAKITYPVLVVTLQPRHSYTGREISDSDTDRHISALWCRFVSVTEPGTPCTVNKMVLRAATPIVLRGGHRTIEETQLVTRSAYGILKAAAEPPFPRIAFVRPDQYARIIARPWNTKQKLSQCDTTSFYTLAPEDENPPDNPNAKPDITQRAAAILTSTVGTDKCLYTSSDFLNPNNLTEVRIESRLARLRRYMLVIVSDRELSNSYVSYFDGQMWYSIARDDEISQKNFLLINQFLIMQAQATPPLPLTPTISVGAK